MSKPVKSFFKYDIRCRDIPNTGSTWLIWEDYLNKGFKDPISTDHIEINSDLFTIEKTIPDMGFGMVVDGLVRFDYSDIDGKKFAIIEGEQVNKTQGDKTLRGFKYHVPSRGILGQNQIWRIYMDIKNGHQETEYVEHLEFKNVTSFTGENLYRIGYALFCEADVTITTDPETGLKTGVLHDGSLKG